MRKQLVGLIVAIVGLTPLAVRGEGLTIGDPAPPIAVSKWVKGDKVEKFEKGQLYVVEYWATWCGPCIVSIPHLSELQKKYKDVTFIGVSVFENDQSKVEPFVKEMGDKMAYRVAMDEVPDGGNRGDGKMATGWMKAAEEGGIPTAFIVNKEGKIAWIGHPMQMDKPLDKIVSGDWDLQAAASKRLEEKAAERKMGELSRELGSLMRNKVKNAKAIVELVDKAIADAPALEANLGALKFEALMNGDDKDAATTYGAKLVDKVCNDNAMALNSIAWGIVDPDAKIDANKRDYKLALRAAQRANELTKGENFAILDTLAVATFETGDVAKALELEEKAVKLSTQKDPGMTERLEKYRKAAEKK